MTSLSQLYYLLDEQKESGKSYDIVLKLIQEKESEVLSQEIIPSLKEVTDILLQNFRSDVKIIISHSAGSSTSIVKAEISGTDTKPQSTIQEVEAHPISYAEPIQPNKNNTKKAPTKLRVTRSNGSIIQEDKAANTLCQVIKEVGAEKVYNLFIPLDGNYLVTKSKNIDARSDMHYLGDDYYVNTHSNTMAKKRQLERIFSALQLSWEVEIV